MTAAVAVKDGGAPPFFLRKNRCPHRRSRGRYAILDCCPGAMNFQVAPSRTHPESGASSPRFGSLFLSLKKS